MKRYFFNMPCPTVWTVTTVAASEDEAWENIRVRNFHKLHELEGTTPSGEIELVAAVDLNNEGDNGQTT